MRDGGGMRRVGAGRRGETHGVVGAVVARRQNGERAREQPDDVLARAHTDLSLPCHRSKYAVPSRAERSAVNSADFAMY